MNGRTVPTAVLAIMLAGDVLAYEMPNHFDMSQLALQRSKLGAQDAALLKQLGLESLDQKFASSPGSNTIEFSNNCKHPDSFSIRFLIDCGAEFEDYNGFPNTQAFNHFFDPTNNGPLTVPFFGSMVKPGVQFFAPDEPNMTSPDWALQDNNGEPAQAFSYADARLYFYYALTNSTEASRKLNWGLLFQSLGQVIHHLQDMAQPQHVRNDQHLDQLIPYYHNRSLYEKYVGERRVAVNATIESLVSGVLPHGVVLRPRDLWWNLRGDGIAQITNRNFVSDGTNFRTRNGQPVPGANYEWPQPGNPYPVSVFDLTPPVSQSIRDYCEAHSNCDIAFYSSEGGDVFNERASSLSIFDKYIQLRPATYPNERDPSNPYAVDRIFTINRYNVEATYPLAMPRGITYSTSLLDYFFRGRLEITAPDEGIYAVVDHHKSEGNAKDTGGFSKIKLKLRNVTPAGGDAQGNPVYEPMGVAAGALRAVVKFHLNTCYIPDLSREYGSPGYGWQQCRSPEERIVVSDSMPVPAGINESAQPLTFTFPTRIPINASDVFLQVVYRGPLGDEAEAVAVATKDISEPTYVYLLPRPIDQVRHAAFPSVDSGPYTWEQWCNQGGMTLEQCDDDYGLRWKWRFAPFGPYDPAASPSTAGNNYPMAQQAAFAPVLETPASIARFGRVAVLTDLVQTPGDPYPTFLGINLFETGITAPEIYQWNWYRVRPVVAQYDQATQSLTPSHEYRLARGTYLYKDAALIYGAGDDGTVRPLQPVETTIVFPD